MTEPIFKKYTDLILTDEKTELVGLMADQGREIGRWLETISDSDAMLVHDPYSWTLKEVVNHLSDCERVFSYRAFWIARGGGMPLVSFDEDAFSLRANAKECTLATLVAEFQAVRASTMALFQNLPEVAWDARGQFMGQDISVHRQVAILLGHVAHHWRIVQQRFGIEA